MPDDLYCRSCRAVAQPSQRFCAACGELYPAEPADQAMANAGPLQDLAAEVRPYIQTKARLGVELEALVDLAAARDLTEDERHRWERTYERWREVSFEITLAVDRVHPRSERDRRVGRPTPSGRPTVERARDDRRDPFWNRAP